MVVIQISPILFTEDIGSFLCLVGESGRIADIRRQTELILSESPHSSFGICGRVSRVMSLIRVWSLLLLLLPSKAPTDPRCQADIKKLFPARLLPFVMFLLPSFLLESNAAASLILPKATMLCALALRPTTIVLSEEGFELPLKPLPLPPSDIRFDLPCHSGL